MKKIVTRALIPMLLIALAIAFMSCAAEDEKKTVKTADVSFMESMTDEN